MPAMPAPAPGITWTPTFRNAPLPYAPGRYDMTEEERAALAARPVRPTR